MKKFPIAPYQKAISALKNGNKKYISLEDQLRTIQEVTEEAVRAKFGETGVKKRQQQIEEIKNQMAAIPAETLKSIGEARTEYISSITGLLSIAGSQLTGDNQGEYLLLANGLVDTPEAMRQFIDRNGDNPALIKMAKQMAEKKAVSDPLSGWASIAVEKTPAERYVGFLDTFFNTAAVEAANSPYGYNSMLAALDDGELQMAKQMGIEADYCEAAGIDSTGSGNTGAGASSAS